MLFKFKALDIYNSKSYMNYCNFIQLCKDYFTTFEAMSHNRALFATG